MQLIRQSLECRITLSGDAVYVKYFAYLGSLLQQEQEEESPYKYSICDRTL